jgi:hypothetical protein
MKIVLVLMIAFVPFLGFAQEGTEGTDLEIQDEAALQELENNREARQEKLNAINEIVGPVAEEKSKESFSPLDLTKTETLNQMEKILKEAKLSQYPPELLRVKILEAFQGNPLEGYVRTSPRLQNFMIDIVRDDKALISAIRIFKDKQRLKLYLYVWIGIMFTAYYTKKLFISKYWGRMTRTFAALLFSLTISTVTLSSFCLIFKEEMKPILGIVKKYL